jgi:diguanylate cyclase (GGDEF)-like protein
LPRRFLGSSLELAFAGGAAVALAVVHALLPGFETAALCLAIALYAALRIRGLLRWRTRALNLEILLAEQLHRVEHHSRRLEAFWKLASQPQLDDDAFLRAVLAASSEGIHPGPQFYGVLAHLDGAEIVIDMNQDGLALDGALAPGARLPFADTLLSELLRAGKTCGWHDVRAYDELAAIPRVRTMPWRAFVGTPFRVGPTVYFLTFTSSSALSEQFATDDYAYIEIVASFCASRLQQRVQFERLRHQSAHDPLTGLPNRTAFRVAGARELASGEPLALAVVDVDRFRSVNETLGHQTADAVLVEVGAALAARAGDCDVVARLSGDTFGVLLRGARTREDAERRVERIHGAFAEPFGTGDREGKERVAVTASIGVARSPDDGTQFERLLARADAAVHIAKENGRARWSFFDRRVEDAFVSARRLQTDLAQALVRDEFVLYFQPQVQIATGRVVGAEALIRWRHPERGLLAPAEFVPFAEEHAMLGAIGAWVMRETVRASRPWRAADPAFRMWFNLSAIELNDPALLRRLHELGDELRGVGVEITESIAMRDVRATMRAIAALREAGLAIALDDFGTGYSSLAHLKRLPIDVVKIDGAFTAGVPDDPHDAAIVEAVLGIASRYGFTTIAEGVETARQASYLLSAGCFHAQGFAYAPPLSETEFAEYVCAARNSRADAAYMRA